MPENGQRDVKDLTPGERLGLVLDVLGLTQTELAEKCGAGPQAINNIIRQGQPIREDFARTVRRLTGVNLNWLLSGEGPMLKKEPEPEGEASSYLRDFADEMGHAGEHLVDVADAAEQIAQELREEAGA